MQNSSRKTKKVKEKKNNSPPALLTTQHPDSSEQIVTRRQCSVNKWGQFDPASIMSTYFSPALQTEEEKSAVILCGL